MRVECPECRFAREVRDNQIPSGAVNARCPQCGARFKFRGPDSEGKAPIKGQAEESAEEYAARRKSAAEAYAQTARSNLPTIEWEARFSSAPVSAFFRTLMQILARPGYFFSLVPYGRMLLLPLAFALLLAVLRSAMLFFALKSQLPQLMEQDPANAHLFAQALAMPWWIYIPVGLASSALEYAVIALACHGALRVLHPSSADLRTTARVAAYANAAWITCIIPLFGFSMGFIVFWAILCVGLRAAHRLTLPAALSATAASLFLLILAAMALAASFRLMLPAA